MSDTIPHILIICPSMWPRMNSWGETQRMYYLAGFLSRNGWRVSTLSPAFDPPENSASREMAYESHYLGERRRPENGVSGEPGRADGSALSSGSRRMISAALTALAPAVQWLYNEPDCYEGISKELWILRYRKRIDRFLAENGVDLVLISAPAFALFRLGKLIKKKRPDLPVIYDYRDPWHLWNLHRDFAYRKEQNYLKYADGIVGFSDIFIKEMIRTFRLPPERCAAVYNGYSEADWTAFEAASHASPAISPGKRREKLRLTFAGNISLADSAGNFRNPSGLIRAVKNYPEIECRFIGVRGQKAGTWEENVRYVGNVSQAESFAYMSDSDVLVSIHHDGSDCSGKYLISGKFYDYIRSGRVIWHIGAPDSLMSGWIERYRLGIACANDPASLDSTLRTLLDLWRDGKLDSLRSCPVTSVRRFSREYQNRRYLNFIHTIKNITDEEEN